LKKNLKRCAPVNKGTVTPLVIGHLSLSPIRYLDGNTEPKSKRQKTTEDEVKKGKKQAKKDGKQEKKASDPVGTKKSTKQNINEDGNVIPDRSPGVSAFFWICCSDFSHLLSSPAPAPAFPGPS
jgi:hypothetical protein